MSPDPNVNADTVRSKLRRFFRRLGDWNERSLRVFEQWVRDNYV